MNQGWQYNFYSPGESPYPFVNHSRGLVSETTSPTATPVQASASVGLKVFSPANKRNFVMLKLREVSEEDFTTPANVRKMILKQAGERIV